MLIKSVELKNVKSYRHETIEFKEGINGICGQNGHGKTTILEAIGYALFDFIPYNTGDFLRHGEQSGNVTVTVEGNDEIEYTIHRKIGGTDYYIKTPVGQIKGKKDVTDWILNNLFYSMRSADDLSSVFENAVGVPQGTFTSAFLLNPGPRKKVFDTILRVEEYQAAYANLLPVINSIKTGIESLERDILPLQTRTEKYQELKQEKDSLQTEIEGLKKKIEETKTKITELAQKKEFLAGKKSQIDNLAALISTEEVRLAERQRQLEKARTDLQQAQIAKNVVDELIPVEESFKNENIIFKSLNDDRIKRDRLKDESVKLDYKIKNLQEKIEQSSRLSIENNELEEKKKELLPKIEEAHKLEDTLKELQKELKDPMNSLISLLSNLREKQRRMEEIKQEISEQKNKITALLPLKNRQAELDSVIKDMKENLETPLRALLYEVSALKEKKTRADKLEKEISVLISKKDKLIPEVEKHRALEEEIEVLSSFFNAFTRIFFDLKTASERNERGNLLLSEINQLETNTQALTPLLEKQTELEKRQQELDQQHAAINSLLKQTKNNMKLVGTESLCPILIGVKCGSVSDFTQYFNNEINSKKQELKDIEEESALVSNELKVLNNPRKQLDELKVLIAAKKKEINIYKNSHSELLDYQKKLKELEFSYPSLGYSDLKGTEDEQKSIFLRQKSCEKEIEKLKKQVAEFEKAEALILSKKKDLEVLSDISLALLNSREKLMQLCSRFNLSIEIETIEPNLNNIITKIKSLEKSLKDLNDPEGQITALGQLILSKEADVKGLKDVDAKISDTILRLGTLNERFHLKEKLEGTPEELELVDELIDNRNRELKALNSPEKEFEKLNSIIEKNLKELEKLAHVPDLLDSCKTERETLIKKCLEFEELDEKIRSVQESIAQLEPGHNKYLQHLPLSLKLKEYGEGCAKIEESLKAISASLSEYSGRQAVLLSEFSEIELNGAILQLDELGKAASTLTESVKGKRKNIERLSRDIASMESDFLKIKEIEKKIENETGFLSFSNFIRDTIKNSSEYIVNEFIGEISQEANNIYCEIMDDYNSGLKWVNDYDIKIESGGESKYFKQLSGGERMSAALSVRLALLKALSNCDFVFLDEPTQNMDEIRREKLSEEIMKIRGFKQVFVISHDDTFNEKYGHVVRIQKISNESRVVYA